MREFNVAYSEWRFHKWAEPINNRFKEAIRRNEAGENSLFMFFGDSVTAGYPLQMPERNGFPAVFERDIRVAIPSSDKFIAGSITCLGGNTRGEANSAREILGEHRLKAGLLVIGYCLNDVFTSMNDDVRGLNALIIKYKSVETVREAGYRDPHFYYYSKAENQNMLRDAFASIHNTAAKNNTQALVVIFPYFMDFGPGATSYRYLQIHTKVRRFAEKANLKVLDLYPLYKDYPHNAFIYGHDQTHPNPIGHKFAADAIYKYVFAKKMLKVPDMASLPYMRVETKTNRATEFCDDIYSGEFKEHLSDCRTILADLIRKRKILSKKAGAGNNAFFINFDLPD